MGGGNGAKAAQKRERNAKDAKGGAKSLKEHCENKHNKTVAECFPGVEIKP
ncbi:hypothetical protein GE09DRAFT_1214547 [Coniochaeta sp. 2T2.1]|nr:hypothetical protein GE09DRAFT_1214547 [Coniochaeta sp. 2T2.1]